MEIDDLEDDDPYNNGGDDFDLCEFCKERVWVSWKGALARYDFLICATCMKELYEACKEELETARKRGEEGT